MMLVVMCLQLLFSFECVLLYCNVWYGGVHDFHETGSDICESFCVINIVLSMGTLHYALCSLPVSKSML
jgi:hypothetical protein